MRNSSAVILTIVGGVFYVLGGVLVTLLAGALSSFGDLSSFGLTNSTLFPMSATPGFDASGINDLIYLVGGFGIVTGILIIVGGFLMKSETPGRRKAGGILAAVMVFIGALPTLGGLFIGFILAAIGCYLGLTYRSTRSNITVGLGPVGFVTLKPNTGLDQPTEGSQETGRGPLNYCIKCGSRLRDGAVFCGACGTRVPE